MQTDERQSFIFIYLFGERGMKCQVKSRKQKNSRQLRSSRMTKMTLIDQTNLHDRFMEKLVCFAEISYKFSRLVTFGEKQSVKNS